MSSGDGCNCPEWVTQCAHDGPLAVWYVTAAAALREYERRTGKRFGKRCIKCHRPFKGSRDDVLSSHSGAVFGPGYPADEPECHCAASMYPARGHSLDTVSVMDPRDMPEIFELQRQAMLDYTDELASGDGVAS